MSNEAIINIDTDKVKNLDKFAGQYVAISVENEIVGNGETYTEALKAAGKRRDFALFAIPKLNFGFAPLSH